MAAPVRISGRIGDRHILLFHSQMSGAQFLLGDYDKERDKLVVTANGLFNFGPVGARRRACPISDT